MTLKPLFFAVSVLLASQTASDKANLSTMASRVLSLTDQARQAISINNKDGARVEVNAALELAGRLLSGSQTRLAPIYTELEEVSILEPVRAAKARQAGQADRGPGAAPVDAEAVQSITGTFTSVSLDVVRASDRLHAAKTAVESGKLQEADTALMAVQLGVVMKKVQTDLPLLRVRQNLMSAKSLLTQGRSDAVAQPLKAAADALLEYQTIPMSPHAGEAMQLQREIDASLTGC